MSVSDTHTIIAVAGPTAVGKTAVAIQLAQHFDTAIISFDSRQCYKEMNIGVARPSIEELASVQHFFIASHSIHETVNAAVFESYALATADQFFVQQNKVLVMVGGTGLYLKAFAEGLDAIPAVPDAIRNTVRENYQKNGLRWLQQQIESNDPDYWAVAEQQNPHRLMRALEVWLTTGKSIHGFQQQQKKMRPFRLIKIGLELPRDILYQRINQRVDAMLKNGLLDEVRSLHSCKHLSALKTVGYQELMDHLDAQSALEDAVSAIKQHTRHYAKRQMTWFKKDTDIKWMDATSIRIPDLIKTLKI